MGIYTDMSNLTNTILNESQLAVLKKEITSINIELECDNNIRYYNNEDYELEIGFFLIRFSLHISTNGRRVNSTYLNPSEYIETSRTIDITIKEVWGIDEEFDLENSQILEIENEIKNNINC